jgi:general secretion pathway protein E
MTSPLQERMRIDGQDRTTLLAAAHRLAAAGGGLPAVMAGLQAEFGLGEEAAGELAAAAFGISAISLAEMSGHSLAQVPHRRRADPGRPGRPAPTPSR